MFRTVRNADMKVNITIARGTESGNVLRRKYRNPHAYAKLRDSWQRDIYILTRKLDAKDLIAHKELKQRVKVSIHVMHKKIFDRDNLWSGCKPIFDSLQRLEFIVNDSEEFCLQSVTQEKNRQELCMITIESL